eukprot:TRINITY_DN1130_c0_g1_i1.p1 TRINITY_DN1130_c0_g1~~TRINITY_DN1130_c0_g1_i1.p1  ORF type:complete len:463 (+),score=96.42 TRINITY_DN1130_c0_g1_i1:156-1544(+)
MLPAGRKEILITSLPSAFAPLHPHTHSSFLLNNGNTYQPTSPPCTFPDRRATSSPPFPPPSDSTSPTSTSTITHCTILGCCVCESEGPVATEFSSTSWTAILKLVLSVLHYHHSKQEYFANNIITHFVKTHWDKISGSKKWNADWKSRISDCLSHNSKCFDSSERGKWRLKDRQHVEETIMRMKDKDREWRRCRETSTSSPMSHCSSSVSSPPLVTPLNLRGSADMDDISYQLDSASYTSPRSPKKQRTESSSSLSSSSGLSPRIGSLALVPAVSFQDPNSRTILSPRAPSPKASPRSNPISPRGTPRSNPISPRGTSSPRSSITGSPRTSLLHYAHHNTNSPAFPFTPAPSAQIPTPSSSSSSSSSSSGSPVSLTQDILSPFTLPPLDSMDVKGAPTIMISSQSIQPPRFHDPSSPTSAGRVPLLNLTSGDEQMAKVRWTDYRTSQDRMTVDRFLTVVPGG